MNNDASSSPAADLPPPPPATPSSNPITSETVESVIHNTTAQDVKTPAQKRAQAQVKKRNEFLAGLLDNLDMLIYVELCVLYYMDCSLFRLLIRTISQLVFFTPKPNFIPPAPKRLPYSGVIFGPNLICIMLHALTARSEAGEAMRGYLHGGVIVDLIGQKGPTSKVHLVLLDLLVLSLQCVMLAVTLEKENLSKVLVVLAGSGTLASTSTSESQPREDIASAQDLEAEERGVMRHGITDPDDIEMESRNTISSTLNTAQEGEARNEEHEQLLAEPNRRDDEDNEQNALDVFYAENSRLATFHVIPALRSQLQDYGNASGSALQTVGFSAEFARSAASRRLNAAHQTLQRQVAGLG